MGRVVDGDMGVYCLWEKVGDNYSSLITSGLLVMSEEFVSMLPDSVVFEVPAGSDWDNIS